MKYFEYVKSGRYFLRIYHRLDGPAVQGFLFYDFYIYGYKYIRYRHIDSNRHTDSIAEYKQALLLMSFIKNK